MKDKSILAIYGAVAFLAVIALVSLYLSVKPSATYEPLTFSTTLDAGPVSLAGKQLPVSVEICNTGNVELLVSGVSTYVQADPTIARALSLPGLAASIVTSANECLSLGRALPLTTGMTPGLWYMNLVVSVVNADGKTQALNQRTPDFEVTP